MSGAVLDAREALELARTLNEYDVPPSVTQQVAAVVRTAGPGAVIDLGDRILTRPEPGAAISEVLRRGTAGGMSSTDLQEWLDGVADTQVVLPRDAAPVRPVTTEDRS